LRDLFFTQQVHGIAGIQVTPSLLLDTLPFTLPADFVHTVQPAVGIGIMAADCLPVVLVDRVTQVVAVVHAGWRGSLQSVGSVVVKALSKAHGTNPADLLVFFGPSAHVCCYQVGPEFADSIDRGEYTDGVLEERCGSFFLNVPRLMSHQLTASGVPAQSISAQYAVCAMCDERFYSHRRDGEHGGRQMTVVCLK
jgi:YfiH family protein